MDNQSCDQDERELSRTCTSTAIIMASCNLIPFLLIVIISTLHHAQHGECDKMTLEKLGEKMAGLDAKLDKFMDSLEKIDVQMGEMSRAQKLNIIVTQIHTAIGARNEVGANKLWKIISETRNDTTPILQSIIISAYSGVRANILPLIRFISQSKDCSGYDTLFHEMEDYEHFFNGPEIFALANSLVVNCGLGYPLFPKFPAPVKVLFEGPVTFQNTFSAGFLYRKTMMPENSMENHLGTTKTAPLNAIVYNGSNPLTTTTSKPAVKPEERDFQFSLVASSEVAESFSISNGGDFLTASASRRLYFSGDDTSKFLLEMNVRNEISMGVDLEDHRGGGKTTFYRLYVQKHGDYHGLNLWTISPRDEYFKLSFWRVHNYP